MIVIGLLIHSVQLQENQKNLELNVLIQLGDKIVRLKFNPLSQNEQTEKKQLLYRLTTESFQHIIRIGPLKIYFFNEEEELGRIAIDWGESVSNFVDRQPKVETYDIKRSNMTIGVLTMTLMIKRNENVTRLSKPKVKPKKDPGKGEKSDSKRRSIKRISWAPTIEEMYVYD